MKSAARISWLAILSLALALSVAGCKSKQNADNSANSTSDNSSATTGQPADASDDPANANVVPVSNATTSASTSGGSGSSSDTSGGSDGGSGAVQAPTAQSVSTQYPSSQYNADNGYGQQADTYAQQPPPALPTYQQPPCPGDGYLWTPGYWHYASAGYYWVPGAWVSSPYNGALWTPGYWGSTGGRYAYYPGYWGFHVGYYGGINYGAGYGGFGYQGGYWRNNQFSYNRTVNNINTTVVRNVYTYRVTNVTVTNVSYNGGAGGVQYRPHPAELVALHEQHTPPMAAQVQLLHTAQADRNSFVTVNHGRPQTIVVTHPVVADHNVRPPAMVHYAAVEPARRIVAEPARPAEAARPEPRPAEARPEPRPEARPAERKPVPAERRPAERKPEERRSEEKHPQ